MVCGCGVWPRLGVVTSPQIVAWTEVVTQIFNLLFRRFVTGGVCATRRVVSSWVGEWSADSKSAIRQVANLRYGHDGCDTAPTR